MAKTLLIIGAGIEQIPGIQLAKKMGLFVVVTDGNPSAPGFRYADAHGVVSTYDAKKTVDFAVSFTKKRKIHGVMTLASDVPLTVSAVAQKLGLPGNSLRTARIASDKLLMKKQLQAYGVLIPEFREVKTTRDIRKFIDAFGYPVVLKPVDSRGARGVLRITRGIDLQWAFSTSKSYSPSQRVMIEKFLPGPQYSTESIIYDNKIFTPGLACRNYEFMERFKPHIIENGGDMPVRLARCDRDRLDSVLLRAAQALGMQRNSLKGDVVWTAKGPAIIEVAARLSGGWFCTDEIPLSTGVGMIKEVIHISLGMVPNFKALIPKYQRGVALRYIFFDKGNIKSVSGITKARQMAGVSKVGINIKPGNAVHKISDHTKRAGYVITTAPSRIEAIRRAKKALSCIKIKWQN